MKFLPTQILYVIVPTLALFGLWDSARQDREHRELQAALKSATNRATANLESTVRVLRDELKQQRLTSEREVAGLRNELTVSIAQATALRRTVDRLQTRLDGELARQQLEIDAMGDELTDLSCDLIAMCDTIAPLRDEITQISLEVAAAIDEERVAREALTDRYDAAIARQNDQLKVHGSVLQQLAQVSRNRAIAEQQLAEQAAADAVTLVKLAEAATQEMASADEEIRVADAATLQRAADTATEPASLQDRDSPHVADAPSPDA